MGPDDVAWLCTPEGAEATALATDRLTRGDDELRTIEALRRTYTPDHSRAALGLALGRATLSSKLADAANLFCDRDAAEQTSHELVARQTARRFAGRTRVADLGCGMGGDALAISEHAPVVAVDRDAGRLAMTAANADVRGLSQRFEVVETDAETFDHRGCDAAWLDPARRDDGGRVLDPDRWSPPLPDALAIALRFPAAGIKLAPGIDRDRLPTEGEREFISLDGRLVAAVLWFGDVAEVERRATILGSDGRVSELRGAPDGAEGHVAPIGRYLYDPDPAVGRAQLVHTLARSIESWQLDARVAYLCSDVATATPFARRFRVLASLPFSERRLLEELRGLEAGRVEVMRRGSPIEPIELAARLDRRLTGQRVLTVALTRVGSESTAIVCERERDSAD